MKISTADDAIRVLERAKKKGVIEEWDLFSNSKNAWCATYILPCWWRFREESKNPATALKKLAQRAAKETK